MHLPAACDRGEMLHPGAGAARLTSMVLLTLTSGLSLDGNKAALRKSRRGKD